MTGTRALAVSAALALGCGDEVRLSAVQNAPPIAVASFWTGEAIADTNERVVLGYAVQGSTARLDGSLSRDPEGDELEYRWTFAALPEGSLLDDTALIPLENDPETEFNELSQATFVPDVLGTFRVRLTVLDGDEAPSNEALVFVQSVPPSQLAVSVDWNEPGADVDVHLTRPGGAWFDVASDCFSWSPNPDWGDPALALDNPELADDNDGEGAAPFSETISLERPPDTAGANYTIRVHYYADHTELLGGSAQPASPTVRIRVLDQDVVSALTPPSPIMVGDVWTVGELTWPDRVFVSINTLTTHGALGGPPYNE